MSPGPEFKVLGISSNFLGLHAEFSSFESSRIAVLPAPYEHTVSYGRGTQRGPSAIIRASRYVEFYDEELDRELCNEVGIATLPQVRFGSRVDKRAIDLVYSRVRTLLSLNKFVVTLGGEHTISQGTIAAHAELYPDLSILQIDAHSDLRDSYEGSRYNHACVMARVCERIDPARIIQVGIRAQCREEAQYIEEKGITTVYAHEIQGDGYGQPSKEWEDLVLKKLSNSVYVSFDVDALDPSIMPGTGTPEPNGLSWTQSMRLLRDIGENKRIVGCDVVEFAPIRGLTHADLTAAKLTYKIMNYAFPK